MTEKIPQPPGVPLLGNIFDVDPNNTWPSLKKLADKYGEIFKIKVLGQQVVFVANVALCEEICDEKRFRKCVAGPVVEIRHSVHDSLFTAYEGEPSWGIAHRIMGPLLTPDAAAQSIQDFDNLASELTTIWSKGHDRLSAIDQLNRLSLEGVAFCFYGNRLNGLTGPEHPMIGAMEGATSEAMKRPNRPGFMNALLYQRKFDRDTKAMRDFAAEMVKARKESNSDRKDMLYAMMNYKDPETGEGLNDQRIIDEIVTLPIGASTAPGLCSAAIYYLCKNPECITKAREEIDKVSKPYTSIDSFPYCVGLVREALRLSAAAPGFNIEPLPGTTEPVQLGGGKYQIPPKQMMITVLAKVNRDPAVFDKPEEFQPERMMGEKFDQLPKGAKRYFGNGKRECIGKDYAFQWSVITMVALLRDIDFSMADPSYELHQDGWFNLRPVDFFIKTKARSS